MVFVLDHDDDDDSIDDGDAGDVVMVVDDDCEEAIDSKHCETQIFKPPRKEAVQDSFDYEAYEDDDNCSYISEGEPIEPHDPVAWGRSARGAWWRLRGNLKEDLIVRSGVSLASAELHRWAPGEVFQQKGRPRVLTSGKGQGCIRMPIQPNGWVTADASRAGGPQTGPR
ncbi:hypothetical protein AK812_SmicGene1481 [Symbiodinium microadriaticum]|uniref:Uncharacterized protein n=1 Tax=Symbiodinium microadriaticum TaxID=2951 RepID=A0A1Q9F402_SYMMI|nr:hypothetical protein AK812_SmicGene1481 [Symbiodinium microadriaticum]